MVDSDVDEIVQRLGDAARELDGKTVVLTGALGFLGRYFTSIIGNLNARVLRKPCRLIAVDNFITARRDAVNLGGLPGVEFIEHDAIQPLDFNDPVDYVMHAAGIASPFYYRAYPLETLEVAMRGTRNMLELATRAKARFCFFSSSEIYGDPDPKHVPTPESYRGNVSCQGPRACYDESKRVGETLAYVFHELKGTHTNTIRPFNVFGPGMQEADYRVLPNFASRIKAGRPLRVYGSGNQTRTFCYVTDAMVGFWLAILRGVPGEAYNIGTPTPEVSMMDLVKRLEGAHGRPIAYDLIEYPDSYPADEPLRRCPDIRKARLQLGYSPEVDLDDGLRRFMRWSEQIYTGEQ